MKSLIKMLVFQHFFIKDLACCFQIKAPLWAIVDTRESVTKICWVNHSKVRPFWEEFTKKTTGVLIVATLPWTIGTVKYIGILRKFCIRSWQLNSFPRSIVIVWIFPREKWQVFKWRTPSNEKNGLQSTGQYRNDFCIRWTSRRMTSLVLTLIRSCSIPSALKSLDHERLLMGSLTLKLTRVSLGFLALSFLSQEF